MKAVYETPRVQVEFFQAENSFAAACDGTIGQDYECLRGNDPDPGVDKVMVDNSWITGGSSCTIHAGYALAKDGYVGVKNYETDVGTSIGEDNPYWDVTQNNKSAVVAKIEEGVLGFIYICSAGINGVSGWMNGWGTETDANGDKWIVHTNDHVTSGDRHTMVKAFTSANVNNS